MQLIRGAGLLMAAITVTAAPANAAPDADAILKKSMTAMGALSTYQAVWVMSMSMGQAGSMSMNMDMKMKPKQQMMTMKMSPAGTPTGQMALAAGMMNMSMVADGKNVFMYMPMMGGYTKNPVNKQMFNPGNMAYQQAKIGKMKYLRTEKLNGKPAHVIQVIPDPKMMRGGKGVMHMFVDAATNRFRQMTMKMTNLGGPNAQPGTPNSMDMKMVVAKEVVNAPISNSVFKFVPPPGAKEIKGGPMGAPGMNPLGGMMGGGAGRK